MPAWIRTNKEEFNVNEQYEDVNITSFSDMQNVAYHIVKSHFDDISSEKEPLCLFVIKVAGKSYLINATRNLLQNRCAVTATTGKAADNIKGVIIHSLLKLSIGSQSAKDLTGQSLCRLQEYLKTLITLSLTNIQYLANMCLVG